MKEHIEIFFSRSFSLLIVANAILNPEVVASEQGANSNVTNVTRSETGFLYYPFLVNYYTLSGDFVLLSQSW